MFFDTHNHSQFSFDGGATTVEKSVKAAVDKGFGGICFTDHCDYFVPAMKADYEPIVCEVFDVGAQQSEIDRVSDLVSEGAFGKSAAKKFRILKGAEIGIYEDSRELNRAFISAHSFDQVIASVHYLEDTDPYFGPYYKGKNWKEAYGRYLETLLREMKKLEDFDIMPRCLAAAELVIYEPRVLYHYRVRPDSGLHNAGEKNFLPITNSIHFYLISHNIVIHQNGVFGIYFYCIGHIAG